MSRATNAQFLLDALESRVEGQLADVIRDFQNLPAEKLLRRPKPDSWSVAECLWHLNSYGAHYLPLIEKNLTAGHSKSSTFTSSWLGAWFTRMMQPGKNKMKAFKDHTPPTGIDPRETVAVFIQQQELLLSLLRRAHTANLDRIRIGLSIAPWLKLRLGDVFQFLIVHQERHMQQARRAAEA